MPSERSGHVSFAIRFLSTQRQHEDMAGESNLLYRMKLTTHVTYISYDASRNRNNSSIPNLMNKCINKSLLMPILSTAVFLNRRAAARYRALASIIPDRERPEETTICYKI